MDQPVSLTYHDGLLAAIPVFVAGGAAAGWWLAIPLIAGVGVGSGVAAIMILLSIAVIPLTPQQRGSTQHSTYEKCEN